MILPTVQSQIYTDKNELEKLLLEMARKNGYSILKLTNAIKFADEAHRGQVRKSGEEYFIHPLNVALSIAEIDLGLDAVIASLLHDVIEDTSVTYAEIEAKFGATVSKLVEGVTKITNIAHDSNTRYSDIQNLRRFLIATTKDIRVLLIKLADRLHNMKTVTSLKQEKIIENCDETLKVYVPLAEYIGIGKWKRELEDIAFYHVYNKEYEFIQNKLLHDKEENQSLLTDFIGKVEELLVREKIKFEKIYGRIKSVASIYRKVHKYIGEGKGEDLNTFDFNEIKDFFAISIILKKDIFECYHVLGLVHSNWNFSEHNFDDYISRPKRNGYTSIHTIVEHNGREIEVHIKTGEMHYSNEFGPASHIAYKIANKRNVKSTNSYKWIHNLNDWSKGLEDDSKFALNLFSDKVFAITPRGKIIELNKGSCVIDFAFAVHTEIGYRFIRAKVNGQNVKVDYIVENGDVIEILTSKSRKYPSEEWLKLVKESETKKRISAALRIKDRDVRIETAKESLRKYILESIKLDWLNIDSNVINHTINNFDCEDINILYEKIAFGKVQKLEVLRFVVRALNLQDTLHKKLAPMNITTVCATKVTIEGLKGLPFKSAKCCSPEITAEIVGIVTLREGLKIHRNNCKSLNEYPENRILKAEWGE